MVWFLKAKLRGAIDDNDVATLKKLLADPAAREIDLDSGRTPVAYAADRGKVESVRVLIALGVNLDAPNSYGWRALHHAGYDGQTEIVALLLKAGADPNLRNTSAQTPLALAERAKHAETADLLRPFTKKPGEMFELPVPPAQDAPPAPDLPPEGWTLMGREQVARTVFSEKLGYRLTDIFDFRARERIRIVNNAETRRDHVESFSFDSITDKTLLEDALKAIEALGGKADPSAIHGGPNKTKLPPPQPA